MTAAKVSKPESSAAERKPSGKMDGRELGDYSRLSRRLVFTKDGEQIWQQIGSLPDGVSLTPPESVNIDGVKSVKLFALNAAAQALLTSTLVSTAYLNLSLQAGNSAAEAKAWQADKAASTPVLDGIATARGITADTLKAAALRKTLAYEQLAAHVAGQRQARKQD